MPYPVWRDWVQQEVVYNYPGLRGMSRSLQGVRSGRRYVPQQDMSWVCGDFVSFLASERSWWGKEETLRLTLKSHHFSSFSVSRPHNHPVKSRDGRVAPRSQGPGSCSLPTLLPWEHFLIISEPELLRPHSVPTGRERERAGPVWEHHPKAI